MTQLALPSPSVGSCRGPAGVLPRSCRGPAALLPGSCWGPAGVLPRSCRAPAGVLLGSCRAPAALLPGSCRAPAGVLLGSCRGPAALLPRSCRAPAALLPRSWLSHRKAQPCSTPHCLQSLTWPPRLLFTQIWRTVHRVFELLINSSVGTGLAASYAVLDESLPNLGHQGKPVLLQPQSADQKLAKSMLSPPCASRM
ncbi:unnamed protein product [Leuciscus chuanchicus]